MSSNDMYQGPPPLTDAELDQLDALNRARTPGHLCAVAPRSQQGGQAIAHAGATWERSTLSSFRTTSIRTVAPVANPFAPTTPEQAEADARAIAAALNALPALLTEVLHLRARDAEGQRIAASAAEESSHGCMLRCRKEGWIQATPLDRAGRRAVWMRYGEGDAVELCGGREGDDCYARLVPGMVLDAALIAAIMEPLERTAYEVEADADSVACQAQALLGVPVRARWPELSDDTAPRLYIPRDLLDAAGDR